MLPPAVHKDEPDGNTIAHCSTKRIFGKQKPPPRGLLLRLSLDADTKSSTHRHSITLTFYYAQCLLILMYFPKTYFCICLIYPSPVILKSGKSLIACPSVSIAAFVSPDSFCTAAFVRRNCRSFGFFSMRISSNNNTLL